MSYSAEFRKQLENDAALIQEHSKKFLKWSNEEKPLDIDKSLLYAGLSVSFDRIAGLEKTIISQLQDMNTLFDSIKKLPKGTEFDQLKGEIEKIKTNREEIAIQIPQNIEKELTEWLRERERAKKAQSEYVK